LYTGVAKITNHKRFIIIFNAHHIIIPWQCKHNSNNLWFYIIFYYFFVLQHGGKFFVYDNDTFLPMRILLTLYIYSSCQQFRNSANNYTILAFDSESDISTGLQLMEIYSAFTFAFDDRVLLAVSYAKRFFKVLNAKLTSLTQIRNLLLNFNEGQWV
jgi:hypothetical protein